MIFIVGCGPSTGGRYALSGNVQFEGKPLETGTIQFVSQDGMESTGAPIINGDYSIPGPQGLKPGEYIVRISSISSDVEVTDAPGPEAAAIEKANKELIPEEYNVTSTKTIQVGTSGNTFDFKIPE